MERPKLEVADVFRRYGEAYRQQHGASLSTAPRRVRHALEVCRTAALGGPVEQCEQCSHERIRYNSCRDRHCPKCPSLARAETINDSEPEKAVRQELSWVRAAREAVWQGSAVALRLLASGDAAMRRAAMSILACFPQHAAQLVPRLRAALERRDASPHERALAGLALAALGTFEEQAFAVGPSAFVRQARDLARTAADGDTDAAATSLLVLTESIDRDAEDLSDWLEEGP